MNCLASRVTARWWGSTFNDPVRRDVSQYVVKIDGVGFESQDRDVGMPLREVNRKNADMRADIDDHVARVEFDPAEAIFVQGHFVRDPCGGNRPGDIADEQFGAVNIVSSHVRSRSPPHR